MVQSVDHGGKTANVYSGWQSNGEESKRQMAGAAGAKSGAANMQTVSHGNW